MLNNLFDNGDWSNWVGLVCNLYAYDIFILYNCLQACFLVMGLLTEVIYLLDDIEHTAILNCSKKNPNNYLYNNSYGSYIWWIFSPVISIICDSLLNFQTFLAEWFNLKFYDQFNLFNKFL